MLTMESASGNLDPQPHSSPSLLNRDLSVFLHSVSTVVCLMHIISIIWGINWPLNKILHLNGSINCIPICLIKFDGGAYGDAFKNRQHVQILSSNCIKKLF